MKLLLQAALANRKHYFFFLLTVFSMLTFSVASQLEMFTLGVVAKTGPDTFMLFGEKEEGQLKAAETLTLDQVERKWHEIAPNGVLSQQQANHYLMESNKGGLLGRLNYFLDTYFHIGKDLKKLALVVVFVAIFKALSLFANRYFTQLIAIRVSRDLRLSYFQHVQKLPLSFYQDYDIGSLVARLTGDAGVVAAAINSLLINFIQTPFALVSTFIACCLMSLKLSMVVFVGFPLIVLPVAFLAKKIKHISMQLQKNQEAFGTTLFEFLAGIMTIKIFGMEELSLKKYQEQNQRQARLDEKSARYGTASRPLLHVISSLFFALVILVGLYVFQLPPPDLFVFCALLYLFYEPIKKFSEENANIQRGVAAAERMHEVLRIKPTLLDAPHAIRLKGFNESLEFRGVSFRYDDQWVLKDLSFTIKKGEFVAIVGPTGSGKSTIVQLIPRLYDVQQGEILIDGKPITKLTQRSLREQISFVSQKPFLFLDTIKENIAFGRPFSEIQVQAAAKNAHAEEFILKLPGGYQHVLSEMGKNLSGGQQQRLAIARALVKKAPILILDEATSALDSVSESKIKEALEELRGKLTQIVIAHRLSTIEKADKIIYIEDGQKIAEGTKEELLVSCPQFLHMWEMMYQTEKQKNNN